MGLLTDGSSTSVALGTRNLVGRGEECTVRLESPSASVHHAVLTWKKGRWLLRDLASRNGTFVDGERVEPGQAVAVPPRARLRFGDRVWHLTEAGPPGPVATGPGGPVSAEDGVLVLPDSDDPRILVFPEGDEWLVEPVGAPPRPVEDGEAFEVEAGHWRVWLPPARVSGESTTWGLSVASAIETAHLKLEVSQDQEHVDAWLGRGDDLVALVPRVHHFLLLELARQRLSDRAAGVADAECGWLYRDELCRRLSLTASVLSLQMLRARQQVGAAGVEESSRLFEVRRLSGQVRIGLSNLGLSVGGSPWSGAPAS